MNEAQAEVPEAKSPQRRLSPPGRGSQIAALQPRHSPPSRPPSLAPPSNLPFPRGTPLTFLWSSQLAAAAKGSRLCLAPASRRRR